MSFTYTYLLTATAFNKVEPSALHSEIVAEKDIKKALSGVTYQEADPPDVPDSIIRIDMAGELTPTEKLALDGVVAIHPGIPLPKEGAATVQDGKLFVDVRPRTGTPYEEYSVNWCDMSTWHTDAVPVVGHTPTDNGDNTFTITDRGFAIVDPTHGKITLENRLQHKRLRVYDNGVEILEEELGWADYQADPDPGRDNPFEEGGWTCDYLTGVITFKTPPTGPVTCDYHKAISSAWYVIPPQGKYLALTTVELNATMDVEMRDSILFTPQIMYAAAAAIGELDNEAAALGITEESMAALNITGIPGTLLLASREDDALPFYAGAAASFGITVEQFKASQGLPLQDGDYVDVTAEEREYKIIDNFIIESQRSYPILPQIGGSNSRAMTQQWFVWRWPYQEEAARIVRSSEGTRIKLCLKHDLPFRGTHANASAYANASPEENLVE